MKTGSALRVVAIALISLATVSLPNASADEVKVEEFFGTGLRAASVGIGATTISDCGDDDVNTNVVLQARTGTVTYTGFMQGTGQVQTKTLVNRCVPDNDRVSFRVLDIFESLTVAGRTGGAVVETVGRGEPQVSGGALNETRIRILCGTGELKGVHGEGTSTAFPNPAGPSAVYQLWVHFGHNHHVGFDFLCQGLDGGEQDD